MHVILSDSNTVIGIEKRELPLSELVHPEYEKHYIETQDTTLKVGDIYLPETNTFQIVAVEEVPIPEPIPPNTTPQELQMQVLADIQLENLQGQAQRQVLGQTLADMELLLMGETTNV